MIGVGIGGVAMVRASRWMGIGGFYNEEVTVMDQMLMDGSVLLSKQEAETVIRLLQRLGGVVH